MKDIDDKIREALREEDSELLDHYREEPAIYEMIMETFRGRFRWLNVFAFIWTVIIAALLCVVAYQFFHVDSTRAMIAYATAFIWGLMWIVMMKIWFWLEMNKNAVAREVKRLELQLANLSRRVAESEDRG